MNDKKMAINVNDISKLYRIGQKIDKNKSFIKLYSIPIKK